MRDQEANTQPSPATRPKSSMSILERPGGVPAPPPERMPLADLRLRLAMRDGIRLDTQVWLPDAASPAPAILMRTPYKEHVMGWKRMGLLRYVEAGYAVVVQLVRGIGDSEGRFQFNSPDDRADGYDTVEWIATQAWCDGAVGMDGSSYLGMTQISAASSRPPHLRCIIPAVPSVDFFKEIPYNGGIFSRLHTINWAHLLQIESLAEQRGGFMSAMPILSQPDYLERMTSRPLIDAADGELTGDFLQHYKDALAHTHYDEWWRERTTQGHHYAAIDLPTLVVCGNFDPCTGALTLWRGLEAHAANAAQRQLLIGPWDHGQCYVGGTTSYGPYELGDAAVIDMVALRLSFFDKHLKGIGAGLGQHERVKVFLTGRNEWQDFEDFPPKQVMTQQLYLRSQGHANSARGDGQLLAAAPMQSEPPDCFVDDPRYPIVAALASARGPDGAFDMAELQREHEVLVYATGALTEPLTLLGEPMAIIHTAVDAPDADLVLYLVEQRADGTSVRLAFGTLRLRFHAGFETERFLTPGLPIEARIRMTYIGHAIPAGSSLRLLVMGNMFPLLDPNPHTDEPLATALSVRRAVQTVLHGNEHPSRLELPTLPAVP